MINIINIFGGPGSGKSTIAAGLFYLMKRGGVNCELVFEYAKDLVYQGDFAKLTNQRLLLKEQHARIKMLVGSVEWAITDSPLLMNIAYADPRLYDDKFITEVLEINNKYNNFNFIIDKYRFDYDYRGRVQSEVQAKNKHFEIARMLNKYNAPYEVIDPSLELQDLCNFIMGAIYSPIVSGRFSTGKIKTHNE